MSQFADHDIVIRRYPYVAELGHIKEIVEEASGFNSMIAYTLVVPELEAFLKEEAAKYGILTIDILGPIISSLSTLTKVKPRQEPGLIRKLDEEYFRKVDAIDFAVKYDDGKDPRGLLYADIVILGVSRTSKTPLSMYLAHKRIRVANLPLVPEVAAPEELFNIPAKKIFGLVVNPDSLFSIRGERLKSLGLNSDATYASITRIGEELAYAKELMKNLGCHIIDVTNKAVEETASKILDIYYKEEHYVK
jgi:regulator of PEP synthase PpsR (kinase-PPPase family)